MLFVSAILPLGCLARCSNTCEGVGEDGVAYPVADFGFAEGDGVGPLGNPERKEAERH